MPELEPSESASGELYERHTSKFVGRSPSIIEIGGIEIGDQSDPAFWAEFLTEDMRFDLIIDDGGHEAAQQAPTLEALLPHLNPGGVYVCEDVHTPDHQFHAYIDGFARNLHAWDQNLPDGGCTPSSFQKAIASVHRYPYVTVIEARETELDALLSQRRGTQWAEVSAGRLRELLPPFLRRQPRWARETDQGGTEMGAGWAQRGRDFGATMPEPQLEPSESASGELERFFDANTEGLGIWKWRHYFPIYERHTSKFVGRSPSIIEIGVFSGGSLAMWQHYFGDGTTIHGIDIEPVCKAYEADGIHIEIGDQSDPAFWAEFLTEDMRFDLIIDDGGHEAAQQAPTLEALLPHLNPGGVYVCEDVHTPDHQFHAYIDGFARNLHAKAVASVHRYPYVTVIEA